MAIPSTVTATALFVTQAPAWEKGVNLIQTMGGTIWTSRSGLEQREQRRTRGAWQMAYSAVMDAFATLLRDIRAQAEVAAPLWVPFWPEKAITANVLTGTTLNLDRITTVDFFAPGDWVLLRDPTLGDQFRAIAAAGSTNQQIILGDPLEGDPIEYPIGTACYPCRLCVRMSGQASFTMNQAASNVESLSYATL